MNLRETSNIVSPYCPSIHTSLPEQIEHRDKSDVLRHIIKNVSRRAQDLSDFFLQHRQPRRWKRVTEFLQHRRPWGQTLWRALKTLPCLYKWKRRNVLFGRCRSWRHCHSYVQSRARHQTYVNPNYGGWHVGGAVWKMVCPARNDIKLLFGYWLIWLYCIIGFLGLLIKAFDNQTESWAWLSSPLIIKLFEILDDNHDFFVYKTFTHKSNKAD